MKRLSAIALCFAMLCVLCGCGKDGGESGQTLTVFAAASMQETLTQIGADFEAEHAGVEVVFNFDSSGTLQTQIESGAVCDVFLSAGQQQMDALTCVKAGSRVDLLENQVVLAVPEGNPAGVADLSDMAQRLQAGTLFLAIGNADVPVGQYTLHLFEYFGLEEAALAELGCLTYGSNVKEVTTHLSESAVDCGIIYRTDACSARLTVVDTATAEMCGRVIYPVAVMEGSACPELAQEFLDYCRSDAAMAIFQSVGFVPAA